MPKNFHAQGAIECFAVEDLSSRNPKRQRTAALQNLSERANGGEIAKLLECGSPLPLLVAKISETRSLEIFSVRCGNAQINSRT